MLSLLLDPLQYGFMQRSLVVAIIVGVLCSVVGSYLVVRRMALLGDAISHSLLPGLAIAFIVGANLYLGAFVAALLSAVIISWIHTRSPIKEDAAMGIVFSAFFALGVTLITVVQKSNKIDLNHFLFGNILGVTQSEVRDTAIIAVLVLLAIVLFYKELLFFSFDPLGAQATGLPTNWFDTGLMILFALTVVASMKAVGVILVLSLLITPAATAYLLVPRLHQMMLVGGAIGTVSSLSGMYFSYYYNLPSGAAIVLVASVLFFLALLLSPSQGILVRAFQRA
ncbi:metal ABC transporter permease [Leptolyngbya sp. GB1-A1]|uniref:metal ABC transporter permease n=3 Tax=Leptolyngbya TaxID=47251 RepID=UPI0019966B84|nr:metal ABC transporter permease [Cyanobacteria bacterium FACHB-502]